jgi:polysaccharide biosynthesis protein PslA
VAQDYLHFDRSHIDKRGDFPRLTRAMLCGAFASIEGLTAGTVLLVSALGYHIVIHHVEAEAAPFALYAGYGALVGLLYAAFSAFSAARFLDSRPVQHTMMADAAFSWTAAFGMAMLLAFLAGLVGDLSRVSLTTGYLVGLPVLLVVRNIGSNTLRSRIGEGLLPYHRLSVVGTRADIAKFMRNGQLVREGHEVIHTMALEDIADADEPASLRAFAQDNVARSADTVVVVGELDILDRLEPLVHQLKRFALNVAYAPATDNLRFKFLDVMALGPHNSIRFVKKPMSDGAVLLKRAFDVAGAGLGLVLLSPFFIIVALLIKLDSPGPIFFRQERRGFNGATFYIWKFRSMSVMESGHSMRQVVAGDPRVTAIGRFLRASSIDELPQLFNVLAGEMSLVGPRPHAIMHDAELDGQLAEYAHRQRMKPGITGWAQVHGYRGDTSSFAQVEGRTVHDLHYIENWSVFLDIWIIVLTVISPKTRRNAF